MGIIFLVLKVTLTQFRQYLDHNLQTVTPERARRASIAGDIHSQIHYGYNFVLNSFLTIFQFQFAIGRIQWENRLRVIISKSTI